MNYIFDDFNIESGSNKIMLSAPHCFPQLRNGSIKSREVNTDTLVKDIAKNLKCSCIYKTKYFENDPNFDEQSTYREQIVDYIKENDIKFLIDVHSMNASRNVDICIGVNSGKNIMNRFDILEVIKNDFIDAGFQNVFIDTPFSASHDNVISSYIARICNIPCFQIEINNKFLYHSYESYNYDLVYSTFENIILDLNNFIK